MCNVCSVCSEIFARSVLQGSALIAFHLGIFHESFCIACHCSHYDTRLTVTVCSEFLRYLIKGLPRKWDCLFPFDITVSQMAKKLSVVFGVNEPIAGSLLFIIYMLFQVDCSIYDIWRQHSAGLHISCSTCIRNSRGVLLIRETWRL